nr:MAG TPA: hypothetical protein [Caudoviricetes sp.]
MNAICDIKERKKMYRIIRESEKIRLQKGIDLCGAIIGLMSMGILLLIYLMVMLVFLIK